MEIIRSNKGHSYIFESNTGYLSLCSDEDTPVGLPVLHDESYHANKLEYLTKHGLIKFSNIADSFLFLEEQDIDDAIINTHQLIFETTDICNLNCYYCGYGQFYDNHDVRIGKLMTIETFISIYEHLKDLWENSENKGCSFLRISFYGGEPLCNFEFIRQAVTYVERHPITNKRIIYSMTTNAVLLNKYMDFIVEKEFEILISLDGNKFNDSYRVFKNGEESFELVLCNIDKLATIYPTYFARNVKFNAVLHNRNSIVEADNFIFNRYGKHPLTNELNVFGIAPSKREEFKRMFHSKVKEFHSMSKAEQRDFERHSPDIITYEKWIFNTLMQDYSKEIFQVLTEDYKDRTHNLVHSIPTKTCIPFSRKIFVSVNGNILPCERIGNEFDFGSILPNNEVLIKRSKIVLEYNKLLSRYIQMCPLCKAKEFCSVCVVSDIKGYEMCKIQKTRDIREIISFFEDRPEMLSQIFQSISMF